MNQILKKLSLWKDVGLISESQKENILQYEKEHSPKNLGAYTVITLGAIVICLGIISLIASNWEYMPDSIKLFLDFSILCALSFGIYKSREIEKKWIFETMIVSYFIMILASIGLISQIYHTGGKFYEASSFWCIITLPIVLQVTGRATLHIWFVAAVFSLTSTLLETVTSFKEEEILIGWMYLLLPALLLVISFLLKLSSRENLQSFGKASLFWSVFGFLTGTILFSILEVLDFNKYGVSESLLNGILLISCILFGICFYLSFIQNKKLSLLLGFGLTFYVLMFASHAFGFNSKFLDTILFILIWFSVGFIFHVLESKQLFEFAIITIGLRFLVAYFQLFASLILTAFGLIISGVLIILVCVLYIKNRERITNWIGELI